jgi:hypothetical protein
MILGIVSEEGVLFESLSVLVDNLEKLLGFFMAGKYFAHLAHNKFILFITD